MRKIHPAVVTHLQRIMRPVVPIARVTEYPPRDQRRAHNDRNYIIDRQTRIDPPTGSRNITLLPRGSRYSSMQVFIQPRNVSGLSCRIDVSDHLDDGGCHHLGPAMLGCTRSSSKKWGCCSPLTQGRRSTKCTSSRDAARASISDIAMSPKLDQISTPSSVNSG